MAQIGRGRCKPYH